MVDKSIRSVITMISLLFITAQFSILCSVSAYYCLNDILDYELLNVGALFNINTNCPIIIFLGKVCTEDTC
jgi:hypothetical protein